MDYGGLLGRLKTVLTVFGKNIPEQVTIKHTDAYPAIVFGSTGGTNFILPKFFYKSKTYNGVTFGFNVVAPSGLGINLGGLGGEFLKDVFIFLLEFSPFIRYTYNDCFSIGIGWCVLYGMGEFNNTVYVPLGTAYEQNSINKSNCTPKLSTCRCFCLDGLPDGLVPEEMNSMLNAIVANSLAYNAIKDITNLPNFRRIGQSWSK